MFRKLTEPCGLHCIRINDIGVTISDQVVLHDISLHIHCGTLAAVIGKNGAGKTTLIRAILGDIPHTGDIEFTMHDEDRVWQENGMELKIGYVPQSLNIDKKTPLSVYDMITCYQSAYPVFIKKNKNMEAKIRESLAIFDAEDLIDRQVCNLSGGQLQRVLLAMAVMDQPDLLLLDEPVSGIDQTGMDVFYQTVADLKEHYDLAIILVSHDLNYVARYADQVILLDGGCVAAQGSAREVFSDPEFLRIFGRPDAGMIYDTGGTAK